MDRVDVERASRCPLARAVVSVRRVRSRIRERALPASPPSLDRTSLSRPDGHLIVIPLSRPRGVRVEDRTSARGARLVGQALDKARV